MANNTRDYEADKQRLMVLLANFAVTDEEGKKTFKYADQLTAIAHREQTSLTIDLEDVAVEDEDMATAIRENTRRYINFFLLLDANILYSYTGTVML